jgi:PPM family protein phosphatase
MNDDQVLPDTTDFPSNPLKLGLWPEFGTAQAQVEMAATSNRGLLRPENEDHFLTVCAGRWLEAVETSLVHSGVRKRSEEIAYGLLVADGLGGADGGELASRTALSTLVHLCLQTPDWIFSFGEVDLKEVMRRHRERFRRIHEAMIDFGRDDPSLAEMGTTLTMACSLGKVAMIGHIGDSRAYLLRNRQLMQLTRDHTLVQGLVDAGELTPEEAADHPWRHVLSRTLGGGGDQSDGDFQRVDLADGDQLLLCTDGLTNMVLDGDIAAILCLDVAAEEACQRLVDEANRNGGFDNITVALARYKFQ